MIGHNTIAAEQLRSVVERVEKLTEEKDAIGQDIREIFAEARGNGLCPRTIRKIIKLRAMDVAKREEEEHILETYLVALGMTPLEELAARSEA